MKFKETPGKKKEKANLILPDEKDKELFAKIKDLKKMIVKEYIKRFTASFFVFLFIFSIGSIIVNARDNIKNYNNEKTAISQSKTVTEKTTGKTTVEIETKKSIPKTTALITSTAIETTKATTTKPSTTTTTSKTTKKATTKTPKTTSKRYTTKRNPYAAIPAGGTINLPLYDNSAYRKAFGTYLNRLRLNNGVRVVANDTTMNKLAGVRAKEISSNFDHSRAGGQKGYSVYYSYNVSKPRCTAENIACAKDMTTPYELYEIWLNSPAHKASMLNYKYTKFGVATYTVGNTTYGALLLAGD